MFQDLPLKLYLLTSDPESFMNYQDVILSVFVSFSECIIQTHLFDTLEIHVRGHSPEYLVFLYCFTICFLKLLDPSALFQTLGYIP